MTQSIIQAWARSISGSAGQVNEDLHAAFDVLGVPLGQINERAMAYTGMPTASAAWLALSGDNVDFALNFLSGILDPRITFTRASTATYTGSDGLLKTAASGEARFDYDPVTLACRGLLLEEARTNLCGASTNVTPGTGTTGAANAPDMFGTANAATTLTETVASSIHFAFTGVSVSWTLGTVYACTVFISPGTATRAQVLFTAASALSTVNDYANFSLVGEGAVLATGSSSTARIRRIGGTNVYACTVQLTAGVTLSSSGPLVSFINSDTATRSPSYLGTGLTMVVHGSQVEVGTFPTSYIPTAGSAVLRQLDSITVPVDTWFNAAEGTLVCDGSISTGSGVAGSALNYGFDDGTANNRIYLRSSPQTGASQATVVTGGVVKCNDSFGANVASLVPKKAAFAYSVGTQRAAQNGLLGSLPSNVDTLPVVTRLWAGGNGGGSLAPNGHLRRLSYYKRALPDASLTALTA